MGSPNMEKPGSQMPQTLSPCSSGRRSSDSNSPEFEFWMVRNPSFPQPNLLSADELFVDGVLRPLHLLHLHPNSDEPPDDPHLHPPNSETSEKTHNSDPTPNPEPESKPGPGPELSAAPPDPSTTALTASKRWKDIFRKSDKNSSLSSSNKKNEDKDREKRKERKAGGGGASSAELNINIWPFSRSRSAGNGGNRPRMVAGPAATRKVSSAPCSRSNSAGESKSRKWPSSPSRGGVHLGRSSPVWQIRRGGPVGRSAEPVVVRNAEKGVQKEGNETRRKRSPAASVAGDGGGGTKTRALNLNVPTCIGYRQHLSCRSDESSAVSVAAVGDRSSGDGSSSGDGERGGNLFNLLSLFTKKVY